MADRLKQLKQGKTAVATAAIVLVTWLTAPALAAPERDLPCDESQDATLEISAGELTATTVSSHEEMLENHLLKSDVKAAAREAFSDAGDDETIESEDEAVTEQDAAEPKMQRVSDGKPVAIKRKMYRRDI